MSFNSGSGNGGALSTSSDVALSAPADRDVITYEASTAKWKNAPLPTVDSNVIILAAGQTEPPAGTAAGTIILREVS